MPEKTLSRGEKWRFTAVVFLLAVLVTAVFTYPLVFQWRTHMPSLPVSDGINHAWFAWWFDKAIFTPDYSPAYLDIIYYPSSQYHPLMTAMPWSRLVSVPAIHLGSSVQTAYNAHLFLSYVLTWVFMALLLLELTQERSVALVGGCIFTYFANRNMHILTGHYTQALTYSYPLLVLALWSVWKRPSIWRGFLLGGALILASTIDLMPLAYFAAPITAVHLLYFFVTDRRRLLSPVMLKSIGAGFGLAALIILPLMWPMLSSATQGDLGWYQAGGVAEFSADALALFIPPPEHPVSQAWPALHALSDKIYGFGYSDSESVVYAGWATLILAAIGLKGRKPAQKDVPMWFFITIFTALLALGPILRLAGDVITVGDGRYIIMPYFLVTKVPLLAWGRTPARLHFTTMFALTILASYGIQYLYYKIKQSRRRASFMVGLLGILLLDAVTIFPWPMMAIDIPPVYETIAADPRRIAVLDLPVDTYMGNKYYMLYQTVHRHAIVGGQAYRTPPTVVENRLEMEKMVLEGKIEMIAEKGVGYIVLHHSLFSNDDKTMYMNSLLNNLGQALYTDQEIAVFSVPEATEIAPPPVTE